MTEFARMGCSSLVYTQAGAVAPTEATATGQMWVFILGLAFVTAAIGFSIGRRGRRSVAVQE